MYTQGFHKIMKRRTEQAVKAFRTSGAQNKVGGDDGGLGPQREGRQFTWR